MRRHKLVCLLILFERLNNALAKFIEPKETPTELTARKEII